MSPERTGRSMLAVALTIVIALGVCAMAAAVMVPTMLGGVGAWPVLAAGCIVLVTALAVLWLSGRGETKDCCRTRGCAIARS